MEYKEVVITPEMAKKILENNVINRTLKPHRIKLYAEEMKSGRWQLNGEDIHISKSGNLLDGQHRLLAIIEAGVPVKIGIKTNVSDDVSIYDRGTPRSTSDILSFRGMDKTLASKTVVSVVKLHYAIKRSKLILSDDMIQEFIEKNSDLLLHVIALIRARQGNKGGSRVNCKNACLMLGALYALNAGVGFDVLDKFFEIIYTGLPDNVNQNAAIVLRNDIIATRTLNGGGGDVRRKILVPMVEKAIYDFVNKYQRKQSYKNVTESTYAQFFN